MKRFGIGSKKGDDGDDANRNALFSRSSSKKSSASDNPYAQQGGGPDPYADEAKYANMTPYQQAKSGLGAGPRPGGLPSGPAAGQRPGGYGSPSPGPGPNGGGGYGAPPAPAGYGADRYGSGGGYGGNKYDSKPNPGPTSYGGPAAGARGPGGYGGFGRQDDTPDDNRDALFSGAQERYAQKATAPPPNRYGAQPDASGGAGDGAYGGYGEQRQLTEEEQEDADYQAILAEKRQVQQESSQSVNRSVQMARQANEVGRATLARLGAQGERLHNTEKHLDMASNQNKIAQDRAAELKTLNRSMFAVHVGNPFTSKQRQQRADEEVMNRHRTEREQRETTRKEGFAATQRMESSFRDLGRGPGQQQQQARKKDYGKFNLEDEEGADELEDQIDDGLNELENQVHMMNMVGRAIGKEVDAQNNQIDRIMSKSDAVDDATRMNRERLARIK